MENPPDLIVVFTSDDQHQEKKKVFIENICQEQDKQQDELLTNLRSDNYALECEIQQLRAQLAVRNNNEFNEQSRLLQQRFQDEIQFVISHHTKLIERAEIDLSAYIAEVLRKSIEDIESLRLLHQKELCTFSKNYIDCIQQQSCEMNELCHHLINQQHENPMNLFSAFIGNFQTALIDLKTSFDSKMNYLSDIHSSAIDKLNSKHETEMTEMKCELSLVSNRRN